MNEFGEWLSSELDRIPWSQRELARQAGVTQTTIARIITGETSPQLKTLKGIARAFGLSMEELLRKAGVLEPYTEMPDSTKDWGRRLMGLSAETRDRAVRAMTEILVVYENVEAQRRR